MDVRWHCVHQQFNFNAFWWGYQLYIPGDTSRHIGEDGAIVSVASALLVAGSSFPVAMLLNAIKSAYVGLILEQNHDNKGVILGATWALPVALTVYPAANYC